ncbi:MAG: WYL domain-containing protein [Chitinophagaceae bacterium]|nr:WYL domain-containing protein [Chitinophagaceae bacterium]
MSAQGTIKRYQLILEKLKYNSYPSFEEIAAYVNEEGFEISKRTLQRDVDAIRNEFNVSIVFDRGRRGYYIDRENSPGYGKLVKLINLRNDAALLQQSMQEEHEYISFEHEGEWNNTELIPQLLDAIKHKKIIEVEHFTFSRKEPMLRRLHPYLLKEYQNRWYLLCVNEKGEVRTYGLDRMTRIKITKESFSPRKHFDPQTYYSNVIGLNYGGERCEEVLLSTDPLTAEYLKSLKWHSTQEVVKEDESEVVFRLYVHINFELVQKILAHGGRIKVLSPKTLINEVKRELMEALKKYR